MVGRIVSWMARVARTGLVVLAATLCCAVLSLPDVRAANPEGRWEFGFFAGNTSAEGGVSTAPYPDLWVETSIEDGASFGFLAGVRLTSFLRAESVLWTANTRYEAALYGDPANSGDSWASVTASSASSLQIALLLQTPAGRVRPYLKAGIGVVEVSDTSSSPIYGGGVKFALTRRWALRLEALRFQAEEGTLEPVDLCPPPQTGLCSYPVSYDDDLTFTSLSLGLSWFSR